MNENIIQYPLAEGSRTLEEWENIAKDKGLRIMSSGDFYHFFKERDEKLKKLLCNILDEAKGGGILTSTKIKCLGIKSITPSEEYGNWNYDTWGGLRYWQELKIDYIEKYGKPLHFPKGDVVITARGIEHNNKILLKRKSSLFNDIVESLIHFKETYKGSRCYEYYLHKRLAKSVLLEIENPIIHPEKFEYTYLHQTFENIGHPNTKKKDNIELIQKYFSTKDDRKTIDQCLSLLYCPAVHFPGVEEWELGDGKWEPGEKYIATINYGFPTIAMGNMTFFKIRKLEKGEKGKVIGIK